MTTLEGRTALVLGANGGIGAAIARALGEAGARLVLAARDADGLHRVQSEVDSEEVRVVPTDITDEESVRALVEQASADGMDIAVNNAGLSHEPSPLGELDIDVADSVLEVTLRGTLVAMHHELAALPDGGSIVNIASTAAYQPVPHMAVYAASKAFVLSLTEALWAETAEHGVRVLAACPGPTETEFFEHAGRKAAVGRMRSAGQVADALMEALDGRSPSFVDGWLNRLIAKGSSFLPKAWVLKIAGTAVN